MNSLVQKTKEKLAKGQNSKGKKGPHEFPIPKKNDSNAKVLPNF
jgi:hypothetical protein